MRRAIAGEFAALDGGRSRVVITLDARLDEDPGPWSVVRIPTGAGPRQIVRLAREADYTVLVAPETTGILAVLTRAVAETGTRSLGSSPEAVALAADKAALAGHLTRLGIDTPASRVIEPHRGLPRDAPYPAVLKPIDGAGSVDTFLVEEAPGLPASARAYDRALLQPFVEGKPMSASYLVDSRGRAWLLAIGEQDVAVEGGRFRYRGGRIPSPLPVDDSPMRAAIESIPGLRGFVGVDFVWDERHARAILLEINPRPTTSLVGLARLLSPGRLAAAWIGAVEPGSAGADLLPRIADTIRRRPPIAFDASGAILDAEGRP